MIEFRGMENCGDAGLGLTSLVYGNEMKASFLASSFKQYRYVIELKLICVALEFVTSILQYSSALNPTCLKAFLSPLALSSEHHLASMYVHPRTKTNSDPKSLNPHTIATNCTLAHWKARSRPDLTGRVHVRIQGASISFRGREISRSACAMALGTENGKGRRRTISLILSKYVTDKR